ncbi:hypothetical protein Xcel_3448 (plasmid) [Xylanimonas cellulosilytica DSM 15894]|uniref:Uncharacterized protein n=1 Tax=Xylanimonas cellulosilytica (strain DSM 15894 / JCM 12276 / CECT 5975 / KCTC 9989 / LMG 20990 / NBRC 107835 / XIL07) TaxID=446471 RepID=D1C0Y1_XYLCX|nr:hypothetical protein [Xylanimonas cellulosilytica]ACZ32447.1 hypothetical protein Xcel_3448 [Xylanimonas cellulosilytica DSM 15894]
MNSTQLGNGIADTPEEEVILIVVGLGALGLIAGSLGLFWDKTIAWLLTHGLLLPAAARPLLEIPGTDGAGLDLMRAAIAAGVLLALIAVVVSSAVRAIRRRRHAEELV